MFPKGGLLADKNRDRRLPNAPSAAEWKLPTPAELRADVVAGLTTAVMLVPQAMAYALLAGLPPYVGLYAAAVPPLAYALTGSSRELAVGPVAIDSLLTAATVMVLADSGTDRYIEVAAVLALLVGVIQAGLGLIRGGFLVNFLSRPVVSGFMSAAALVIAASQLRTVLGLELPRSPSVFEVLQSVWARLGDVHLPTAALAAATMACLWAMRRWAPKWPRALIVVVAGIVIAGPLGLADSGLGVVGAIPPGLPSLSIPAYDPGLWMQLATGAVTIAFISFMEGISISTKLAEKSKRRVRPDREFFSLGIANVASGLFGGYPVAGGLSRTAVNAEAGAATKLSGVITALAVLLTLAFFTDALHNVPTATLGAIIIMAVVKLIDYREPSRLWKMKRTDLAVLLATFAATLLFGIREGILSGVGLSIGVLVVRTTRPHTAVLGRLPGTQAYRNVVRFPNAVPQPGILILRLDAQLYFGNVTFLRDSLARLESEHPDELRGVVLDTSGINQLDSSAEKALSDILEDYRARGIRLLFANVKGPVRDVMVRSGLLKKIGPHDLALRIHDAVVAIQSDAPTTVNAAPESDGSIFRAPIDATPAPSARPRSVV